MATSRAPSPPVVITPPPKMLEYFLLTGRWPSKARFMAVLTDRPEEEVEHGARAARPAC